MHQASVGFHCPECARAGRQKVYTSRSLVGSRPLVTLVLVALNVMVFVLELSSSSQGAGSIGTVGNDLSLLARPIAFDGDWWRPVTAGFVHAGLLHIGLNMFILWQLGLLLEAPLGRVGYVSLYFMSLLGGSALVLVLDPDVPTVGASGAVFGLMGAAFVGLRSRGIDPFSTSIGPLIVLNLVFTFLASSFVSVGGHVGGLIAGAVGGLFLFELPSRIPNGKLIAPALCAVSALALYGACLYVAENPF
jgi:membrane associated rhomboid family serine protease